MISNRVYIVYRFRHYFFEYGEICRDYTDLFQIEVKMNSFAKYRKVYHAYLIFFFTGIERATVKLTNKTIKVRLGYIDVKNVFQ